MGSGVGRNSHCPCGSRKKYKKCCMPASERRPAAGLRYEGELAEAGRTGGANPLAAPVRMHPYVLAKAVEVSEHFAELKRTDPVRAAQIWTPGRVAALATEEIIARLGQLGIDGTHEAFVKAAEGLASAWTVSDGWRSRVGGKLSPSEDDFLGLASCELWKRYCPDRPSMEMLDDWMQDGYDQFEAGKYAKASDHWLELWAVMRTRLLPDMRTCDRAEPVLEGTQSLYNWLQDLGIALQNAGRDEPRFAQAGVAFSMDVLAQFRGESDSFLGNFQADLGEFHFLAGEPGKGEGVLQELILQQPEKALGYVRLADMLGHGLRTGEPPIDPERAVAILRQALTRPVRDAGDYDIEARIHDPQQG